MKFYSDITKSLYDTQDELVKAEKVEADKKAQAELKQKERSVRAKEVEDAYKEANDLMDKFIKDYGNFHTSFNNNNRNYKSLFDILFNL